MKRQILARDVIKHQQREAARKARILEMYSQFIHLEGLSATEQKALLHFITNNFTYTSDMWEPTSCRAWIIATIDYIAANKIVLSEDTIFIPYNSGGHEFGILQVSESDRAMIVDPTGIGNPVAVEQTYLPHFGLLEFAPPTAYDVYQSSTSL